MGKQTRAKKSESLGKGKVTPMQVAFIVDRYLSDNNFSQTRTLFRTEASSLISNSPLHEAPKSLLTLGAMLNEYISLKEEKVMLGQERARLEQEKLRVHSLLQGMQEVMNAYNASATLTTPPSMLQSSVTIPNFAAPQLEPRSGLSAGYTMYKSAVIPAPMPSSTATDQNTLSTPTVNRPLTRKRTGSNISVEGASASKRTRSSSKVPTGKTEVNGTQKESSIDRTPTNNITSNAVTVQGTGVENSFNQPLQSQYAPTSSSSPITPPQLKNKCTSPIGVTPNINCVSNHPPQDITPTNCTVITSERVIVSPCKKFAYYTMERSHCVSSSSPVKASVRKREFVKGRLDFDCPDVAASSEDQPVEDISASGSDKDGDFFDIDFPNIDDLGPNFSFSELLTELDIGYEGVACSSQPILGASVDNVSGSSQESIDGNLGSDQGISEFNSTQTELILKSNENVEGGDALTAMRSITKSIVVLSPWENQMNTMDLENSFATSF